MRGYWLTAWGADLFSLSRVHCSKGKTSNTSLQNTPWSYTASHHPGLSLGRQRSWRQTHQPQQHMTMQMVGLSLTSEMRHFLQSCDAADAILRFLKHLQKSGPSSFLVPDLSAVDNKLTPTCDNQEHELGPPACLPYCREMTHGGQPSAFRNIQAKPVIYCQKSPLILNPSNTHIIRTFQISPSSSRYDQ